MRTQGLCNLHFGHFQGQTEPLYSDIKPFITLVFNSIYTIFHNVPATWTVQFWQRKQNKAAVAVPKHTGSIWFRLPQFAHILLQNWATNHSSSVDFAWFYIEIESPSVTQRHCWTLPEVPNMWSTMKHHRSNMLQQSHSLLHQSLNIIELSHAKKNDLY